ncbi:MAG TPA: FecR domain-containing protein, partial [Bradyrhizobium sp.]|nr:FecR domain-containing protein [Bradyrhizobium sp.]
MHDYFKGETRATLASPDGAQLTGDLVKALSGHVEYAQANAGADASKVIGHVTKLAGTATCLRNGVAIILTNGDNVEKGDVVQTGSESTLGITFIDGSVFGLLSNARMVLNEMIYDPNGSSNSSLLSLVAGTITFVAGETAKHGDMKVDTPVATMGIRGTAVLTEIDFQIPLPPLNPNVDPLDLSQFPAPVAKFQVLVEPDGSIGSYILYDKNTLTPYAEVKKAGEQINISQGVVNVTNESLPPDVQKLIQDVFSLKFSDNTNTKSTVVQNDSIVPKDGSLTFTLPDGATATALFVNFNHSPNDPLQNNNNQQFFQILAKPEVTAAGTHGPEGSLIALDIVAASSDDSMNISGIPSGAQLTDNTGKPYTANADGSYTLTPAQLSNLFFDATKLDHGTVTLTVVATNTTTNHVTSVSDVVTVDPVADNPVLSGVPSGTV